MAKTNKAPTNLKDAPAAVPTKPTPQPAIVPRTAAVGKTDLLHVEPWHPETEPIIRAQLIASILESLAEMEYTFELQQIAQFIDIINNEDSPAENFILDLIREHFFNGLTPDAALEMIECDVEGFRVMHGAAVHQAKHWSKRYHGRTSFLDGLGKKRIVVGLPETQN